MKEIKMKFVVAAFLLTSALSSATAQQAQLPSLVKMIVPFSAGGSNDVVARGLANQLSQRTGSSFIVENRPGASGMIGALAVAKGPKDGSQLLLSSVSIFTTAATTKNAPFNVVTDLVPVAMVYDAPFLVGVAAKSPIKTPTDLIAAARARPGEVTHGTGGVGTIAHLSAELLNEAAKIQLSHIPYKGAAVVVTDVIAGNVDMMMSVASSFYAQVQGGRMRAIAITSANPNPAFPGVPTMTSAVPGFTASQWVATFVPSGTPSSVVDRLNKEINEAVKTKEVQDIMHADGATALPLTPEGAARFTRDSYTTWKRLATTKNIWLD